MPALAIPLSSAAAKALASEPGFSAEPALVGTYQWSRTFVTGRVSMFLRPAHDAARFLPVGSEIGASAAVGHFVTDELLLSGELSGSVPLSDPGLLTSPAELLAGVR